MYKCANHNLGYSEAMNQVAFINTKGGTGKTTSVLMLAKQLAQSGERVEVVDTDPQQSALRLVELVKSYGMEYPFEVSGHPSPDFYRFTNPSADWVIVDTPPGEEKIIRSALSWADLVIVPAQPSFLDIDRTLITVELVKRYQKTPHILITQAQTNTIVYRETLNVLEAEGLYVYPVAIPKRTKLTDPVLPDEACGYDDLAQIIREQFTKTR